MAVKYCLLMLIPHRRRLSVGTVIRRKREKPVAVNCKWTHPISDLREIVLK